MTPAQRTTCTASSCTWTSWGARTPGTTSRSCASRTARGASATTVERRGNHSGDGAGAEGVPALLRAPSAARASRPRARDAARRAWKRYGRRRRRARNAWRRGGATSLAPSPATKNPRRHESLVKVPEYVVKVSGGARKATRFDVATKDDGGRARTERLTRRLRRTIPPTDSDVTVFENVAALHRRPWPAKVTVTVKLPAVASASALRVEMTDAAVSVATRSDRRDERKK